MGKRSKRLASQLTEAYRLLDEVTKCRDKEAEDWFSQICELRRTVVMLKKEIDDWKLKYRNSWTKVGSQPGIIDVEARF